jgi:nucleotide-binding universal stress UspA family protein
LPVVWEENEKLVAQKAAELKKASTPIPTEWITSEGDPALEIEELASNMKCDLIVMGSHGRSGLARLLMGSVAEHVVRKAECPVLIIKKPVPAAAVAQLEPVAAGCDARPDTEC